MPGRLFGGYWARRLGLLLLTALLASVVVFLILRVLPGDIADLAAGDVVTSPEVKDALREELGLNNPLPTQYFTWLGSLISGDFGGKSLVSGQPIGDLIARQLPVTFLLTLYALVLAAITAIPLGIAAALRHNHWQDNVIRWLVLPGQVLPNFWLALLLLLGLVLAFRWSPPLTYSHPWQDPWNHLQMVALPVLLLSWEYGSHIVRVTRSSILTSMQEDYVTASRARGLSERRIVLGHALPAAGPPVITVMGLQFGVLLSGAMILESIFGLPGLGRGLVEAAQARDFPVVQTYVALLVLAVLLVNLIVDLAYKMVDPRIEYKPQIAAR